MYSILNTFFKEMEVVNHQLVSYNDFIPTEDNPDSGMQQVFDTLRVTEDDLPGEMKLDRSKTGGVDIRIRFGRRKNVEKPETTISIELPKIREPTGSENYITPLEARLRDLNYLAPLFLDFTVLEEDTEIRNEKIKIGEVPVMVRSKICILHKNNAGIGTYMFPRFIGAMIIESSNRNAEVKEYLDKVFQKVMNHAEIK